MLRSDVAGKRAGERPPGERRRRGGRDAGGRLGWGCAAQAAPVRNENLKPSSGAEQLS